MNWILFCIVILIFLIIAISIIDMKRINTVNYKIASNKIMKNTRIVFLSDLHNNVFGKNNIRLLNKIDELKPDYIFIGGDMMVANGRTDFNIAENLLSLLTSKYRVFYGLGNHEYRVKIYKEDYNYAYQKYLETIQNSNLVMLDNQIAFLEEEGIVLSGLTLDREFYHRIKKISTENMEIESIFEPVDDERFQILLAHNPVYFEKYDAWGADLTLSGHLHGGIMKLPFLGGVISSSFDLFPKYDGGVYNGKKGQMIVSRGLGAHTIPLRIFNPCELVCVDLQNIEKS